MNKDQGFVKLNRGFFENPFWMEDRVYSLAEAWLDLIQMARFENSPEKVLVKMKFITINRGELRASQRYLSTRWNWSLGKTNRFLKLLENEQMVERRMEHSETVVKLLKYEVFNTSENTRMNTHRHSNGTPTEHQQIQTKESKESKEGKNNVLLKKEPKEGEILETQNSDKNPESEKEKKVAPKKEKPPGFHPPTEDMVREYCESRQNGVKPNEFVDFYTSKGWMVGRNKMKDWKAAVRTWENTRRISNTTQNVRNGTTKATIPRNR